MLGLVPAPAVPHPIPDDRGERLQHLLDLQLGQVPVCCQRTCAVGHDRPSMRVQAKRSLYGAKPGRLIVARCRRGPRTRPAGAQQCGRQGYADLIDSDRECIGQARLL